MATSIKFDSTEILGTTYVPRFVKHEQAPEREINSLPLTREDGEILISERYGIKTIPLEGIITGTSQANLEANIDTFKELLSRLEKNLDIDWNGSTRRYVATCISHNFDRDFFHLLFVPWTAEFQVLSGEGKDTTATVALNENVVVVTTPGTDSFTMAGSKPAKPKITIKGANFDSKVKGIEYLNVDTGEKIVITANQAWGTTSSVIIDCLLKKVTANLGSSVYTEKKFYGVFPAMKIGTNNVKITAGGIVNQESGDKGVLTHITSTNIINSTSKFRAQGFSVPYSDETFKGIQAVLEVFGSPGNLTWRIETDANGEPSGNLADVTAGGSTGTITPASVPSRAKVKAYSADLWALNANTKYWLVFNAAGVDVNNYWDLSFAPVLPGTYQVYTKGHAVKSDDSGGTWALASGATDSYAFAIMYGGQPDSGSVKHSVEYTKTYL